MSFVAALDPQDAGLGGKARSLAGLAAAGLPTPPGFVVTDALFRALCPSAGALSELVGTTLAPPALNLLDRLQEEVSSRPWPSGFSQQLRDRLDALGTQRFSVRSSFVGEDKAGALAAGVYESCIDVPPAGVAGAIRRVLRSAVSPGATAYALAHGQKPAAGPCAVLIHAYLAGDAEGSAARSPDVASAPVVMVRRGSLPPPAQAKLLDHLAQLSATLGAVEVEWVLDGARLVFLQARPFQARAEMREWSGWGDVPSRDRSAWRWDAAHNPLPLSSAQAGLVEFVDEHCHIGIRQRVLGGYLFYAADGARVPGAIEPVAATAYFEDLCQDFDRGKQALGPAPRLEDALRLFASVYERIFGVLQPALKRARRDLHDFLASHAQAQSGRLPALTSGVDSMATERSRRASDIRQALTQDQRAAAQSAYLALFGDEAPIWDLSAPTYAEDASPLHLEQGRPSPTPSSPTWLEASARIEADLSPDDRARWRARLALAREAARLSEADDWLYARAQALVRQALLALGRALRAAGALADPADVFFLPLSLLRRLDADPAASAGLPALVAAGRATWDEARRKPPPASASPSAEEKVVRGHGTGGRAIGPIAVHRSGSSRPTAAEAVVLAQTLLPTELPLITAAAIVTETGGPLDHVAAQARERGIPAVIGAAGACQVFRDGDLVLVDGDRGLVVKLGRA